MKVILATVVTLTLASSAVLTQTAAPTPGPEQKRMAYFAGQWNFQGETKASPLGPAGKTTSTETCEWFAGGFHLVCRTKGTGPKGPATGQSVTAYDQVRKTYTFHAISSLGDNIVARGQVAGKIWTWTDELTVDGKPTKIRATVTEDTPTSYSFKLEVSMDGGPMMVIEEGKSTKVS